MTVAAETITGQTGAGVALIAERTIVIMPVTLGIELTAFDAMNYRIGSSDTIEIDMTTATRTGWIATIMTDGTVFNIGTRR